MATKMDAAAGRPAKRRSPKPIAPSDVGDGLTPGERVMRMAVMRALDEAEQRMLEALADPHPIVAADRERAIREIADLVMRSAARVVSVDVRRP